jgi:hypothetical protein
MFVVPAAGLNPELPRVVGLTAIPACPDPPRAVGPPLDQGRVGGEALQLEPATLEYLDALLKARIQSPPISLHRGAPLRPDTAALLAVLLLGS